ncbi:MAG: hypothetical protein Q7V19_14970, partial [Bacteroidales bacterium]|nr:hypothetical protein [Bacteroidales bacterium]
MLLEVDDNMIKKTYFYTAESLENRHFFVFKATAINRTILELKPIKANIISRTLVSINRTILELKRSGICSKACLMKTINRTILELKQDPSLKNDAIKEPNNRT